MEVGKPLNLNSLKVKYISKITQEELRIYLNFTLYAQSINFRG